MKNLIAKIKSWPLPVKIIVPATAVIALAGIIAVVVLTANVGTADIAKTEDNSAAEEETEASGQETESESEKFHGDAPLYTGCSIITESLERDLTIYIDSESGSEIKGSNFSFKIARQQETDPEVQSALDALKNMNQSIDDLQKKNGTDEFTMEKYKELLAAKKEIVDRYAEAVNVLEGDICNDDDSDGMIYIEEISAGTCLLYYIPVDGYDPEEYVTTARISATAECKVIETIDKKMVSESEAGDTDPSHLGYPSTGMLKDTVKTTDSMIVKGESEYSKPKEMELHIKAEVSDEYSKKTQDCNLVTDDSLPGGAGNEGFGETGEASSTQAVLEISKTAKLYACEGASSATLKCSSKLVDGISVTVSERLAEVLTAKWTGKKCEIAISDITMIQKSIEGTVTLTGIDVAGNDISVDCQVTVAGSDAQIFADDGEELFIKDKNGRMRAATLEDYKPGAKFSVKNKTQLTEYYGWQTIKGGNYYYDADGEMVKGTQVIDGVSYKFDPSGRLLSIGGGIDVSSWQGPIDWNQAAKYISYAFIRCGYRGQTGKLAGDSAASENLAGAKKAGVKVGIYFYSRAKTPAQAVEEASVAVKYAKEAGGLNYPIYIALEDSVQKELSKSQLTAVANAFCKTVSSAGYRAGVYASKSWLSDKIDVSELGGVSVWCVEYSANCSYKGTYAMWQYTAKGVVPGVPGKVNLNK